GAARSEILVALAAAHLRRSFRFIIASENVRRGKPHPEGYRAALARLGRRAGSRPFAIEDSPGGIRAALAAGLPVLGVATSYRPAVLRRAGAFAVIPTLARPGTHLRSL
ncbi:MAG TPA: HAD family phosphatase, partial [Candidatus Polarisedimenticolia bacterium]|nr:HAD family phosphatase [Candidatus Polarisedimenticolia bacterium]